MLEPSVADRVWRCLAVATIGKPTSVHSETDVAELESRRLRGRTFWNYALGQSS